MAMNIKQAKQEIRNTLRAYLSKDDLGNYLIPPKRQRPVLLMGPPGIGKTQIMEQIAEEEGIPLISYTMTHHTRQSVIGLPFIVHQQFQGEDTPVTEYTMSEILATVYEMMEKTGRQEGILFLDEINCVSETLTPVMLQFLQYKTFGNRKLPDGWLIVTAGNPPEYNKSAREFDVATMDRVKMIEVQEDFSVWKEYAYRNGIHGAIISYLDIKKENFFRIENTVDGMRFITARGWEDLSEMLQAYEKLGIRPDRQMISEYIQLPGIARDFAGYLDLYRKYQETYHVDEILRGKWKPVTTRSFQTAPFDEKLSVMGLLHARLSDKARETRRKDALAGALHSDLIRFRSGLEEGMDPGDRMEELADSVLRELKNAEEEKRLSREERELLQKEYRILDGYTSDLRNEAAGASSDQAMDLVREWFAGVVEDRGKQVDDTSSSFDHAFGFLEQALGDSQEMVIFVTNVTAGYDTSWFVQNFGCEAYYRHNRELLFDDVEQKIRGEIRDAEAENQEAASARQQEGLQQIAEMLQK